MQHVCYTCIVLKCEKSGGGSATRLDARLIQRRGRPRLHIKGCSAPNFGGYGGGRQVLEELVHPAIHFRDQADAALELLREESGHDREDDPGGG